ncbi:uncharacterized protein Z518_08576 [Rhinocladiella mackenziei CBS 650.93]|uniref:Rhinocladiella mackenziei CBS 650.93 unplaced genomic scaffold supercont1.6, whole genome shotgun sequence n=1 Tax=Rhinocladiella mackenziei CBS 650.93 TaxID=1442369 RepID=A0A0D2I9R5_9EURO|nr:uncharacterized protein Z518_08576 [Rhinocladiella mackenziei CBS 650.93]KIX02634.1 hypothetical protein Z518_08576 [Rhinocladiella mackenziei CBS 650.93]
MTSLVPPTPARPVPGVWPQTPAARPSIPAPSFQSPGTAFSHPSLLPNPSSSSSLTTTRPVEPPAQTSIRQPESLEPLERAARAVNEALTNESRFPEVDGYLSQGYSADYDIQSSTTWAPFQKASVYKIPDEIFEQYNNAQLSTSMGLFAELRHAWTTIDNALYMWDYTSSKPELLGFEGQPHSILAVKLAVPRAGVFLSHIKHVIILATTSDIFMLGLGPDPSPGASDTLSLFQTGMSVSVKGLDISVIACSSKTGRIFFGGRTENEIYELTYQQEDRWFSSRCSKICHTSGAAKSLTWTFGSFAGGPKEYVEQIVVDDSRDLLYTLSSASNIRVFHVKPDGGLPLLITKPANEIYANIGHIITQNESLNVRVQIVSISPIPAAEASRYHLMATTATGYRIYLSATSSGYWPTSKSGAPISMQAQHVKIPPMTSSPGMSSILGVPEPSNSIHQPIKTLTTTRLAARYSPGYFFCFTARDANATTDQLFISAPDAARLSRPAEAGQLNRTAESAIWLSLGSRAEDIGLVIPYSAPTSTAIGYGNDLAVQFDKPIPEVAILTNTGIHIIRRRRLVDILAALSRQGGGSEGFQNEVNNLIRAYGRTETLATALAVACGQGVEVTKDAHSVRVNDPDVLELARKTFIEYGGKPSINQNSITDKSVPLIDAVRPSPRHAAIALYLSRLLRSTWKSVIAVESTSAAGYQIHPAVPLKKLRDVQESLSALQRFFKTNKSFIKGLSGPDDLSSTSTKDDEIALKGEHRALHSLVKFTSDTIEGLSFILVLFEEKVAEILPLLPEASRPQMLKLTFEELFTTKKGYELAKELVKAIVNRNIAKGSNVETVAEALRRKCGSFCSADDVVIFKAQEQLKRAAEAGGNVEFSRNLLNESLKLFEQVAHSLPSDYLESAVKQYTQLQFFAGAIQLVLRVAHEKDRANEALSWMAEGRPESDVRQTKFDLRSRCYDLIHEVIIAVDKSTEQGPSFVDGRPTVAATRRNEAYDVISRSTDEAFLTNLYDWYLQQGWDDRLLATDSSFIVTYLQRKSSENIHYADLLWRYYGQTNQFAEAAKIQWQLARSSFPLSLEKRIEYLSRARANASTYTPGGNRKSKQQLLKEISDLLDIAMIQDEILQRLRDDPRLGPDRRQEVLGQVNGAILDINTLFNNYADNAGYYDLCLLIYQVADHRDSSQIKQTWQQLLQAVHDKTEEEKQIQPFEAIAEEVRSLGSKLRVSEATFPVQTLLPILEKYSFEHQRSVAPPHWVVDIFLDLEIAYEQLFEVLEMMFFSGDSPFIGSNRKYIVSELVYVVGKWFHDSMRAGSVVFGSEVGALRVQEIMQTLLQQGRAAGLDDETTQVCRAVVGKISQLLG